MSRGNAPEVADAALAIVADDLCTNEARAWAGERWISTSEKPNTFKVIHMGKVQGPQTINRAELWALCKAYSMTQEGILFSDSTYAKSKVTEMVKKPELERGPNLPVWPFEPYPSS